MENSVSKAFGAFPERLFIIQDKKIAYEGGMGPFFYNLEEVRDSLVTITKSHISERHQLI